MRSLILAAALLGALAAPVAAQPHAHAARRAAASFQALSPAGLNNREIAGARIVPAAPLSNGEYSCIWGLLGRC